MSVCHCLACQSRTGSAFSAQASFRQEQVTLTGETRAYARTADSGRRSRYQFCALCGSPLVYAREGDDVVAAPLGAFVDPLPMAPSPAYFERRCKWWVRICADDLERFDLND